MQLSGNGAVPPITPLVQLDKPELHLGLPNKGLAPGATADVLGYGPTVSPTFYVSLLHATDDIFIPSSQNFSCA